MSFVYKGKYKSKTFTSNYNIFLVINSQKFTINYVKIKESAKRIYNNQRADKRTLLRRGGEHGKQIIFSSISNLSNPQLRIIDMKTLAGNSLVFNHPLFILVSGCCQSSGPPLVYSTNLMTPFL